MPATICSSVLLPEPFSPTMQKVSPRLTSKLTSRSAQKSSWNLKLRGVSSSLSRSPGDVVDRVALGDVVKEDLGHFANLQTGAFFSVHCRIGPGS